MVGGDELSLLGTTARLYTSGQLALILRVIQALMPVPRLNVLISDFSWCGRFGYRQLKLCDNVTCIASSRITLVYGKNY